MKRIKPASAITKLYIIAFLAILPVIAAFVGTLNWSESEKVCRVPYEEQSTAVIPGLLNGIVIVEVSY